MEVEITEIPELKPGERALLDMHSLLNVMNVLRGELALIGLTLAQDPNLLRTSLRICDQETAALADPVQALEFAAHVKEREAAIEAEVAAQVSAHPAKAADPDLRESQANLRSVFHVLRMRAQETLSRAGQTGRWVDLPIEEVRTDFRTVFAAIEKNSKGRYRILYNLALQQPSDYYVDFVVESADGRSVALPQGFPEVMRDLIANARKYTLPGGTINIGLHETDRELRFVVQDTGIGIPPDEIRTVVRFGQRGSNAARIRTMGGGFGLTKAVVITRQLGGRFWIRSEVGTGTRVTIGIPRPVAASKP